MKGFRWKWLFVLIVAVAITWALILLHRTWPELRADLPKLKASWLLLPMLGATVAGYLGFECYHALYRRMEMHAYGRLSLAHLYFIAQLMKHLPGRFWGIAYQSSVGHHVGMLGWASVQFANIALATVTAVWMALGVLGFYMSWQLGALVVAVGFAVCWGGWNGRLLTPILVGLRKLPGSSFEKVGLALLPYADCPSVYKTTVLLWFVALWGVYVVSWVGYGLAWPGLTPSDGMLLCALYTLAWLAGFFSFITPSGMGIRELVFALLAHRYPADVIAGLAVFGRAMLLVADIVLGIAFGVCVPERKTPADTVELPHEQD